MVRLTGNLTSTAGAAVCGAAVAIFPTSVNATQNTNVCCATATTTTNSSGVWDELALAANKYDVRITCGSSKRWRRYGDEVQHATFQTGDSTDDTEGNYFVGIGNDAGMRWSTSDASNHALVWGVGDTSQQMHITDRSAMNTDWARCAGTHPELAIHSNTTPATDYLALGNHDGTTATINMVGGTTLGLAIAGNTELNVTASGLCVPANSDITFSGTTGTNDIVLTNALADALSITDGSADILVIDTNTAGNVIIFSSVLDMSTNAITGNGGSAGILIDSTGAVTMTSQPLVIAYNSAQDCNVTGDCATATVDYDTEVKDQNGDFATDTFTAPITGTYQVNASVATGGSTTASTDIDISVVASNRTFYVVLDNIGVADGGATNMLKTGSFLIDMDSADTLTVTVNYDGECGNVVDIVGSSDARTSIGIKLAA